MRKGNTQNLRTPTHEEAVRIGRKGGINSGKAKRARKVFKQILDDRLSQKDAEKIIDSIIDSAKSGSLPAYEFILTQLGEHPDQGGGTENSITINIGAELDKYAD